MLTYINLKLVDGSDEQVMRMYCSQSIGSIDIIAEAIDDAIEAFDLQGKLWEQGNG
jgi:hypothetical protein